MFVQSRSTMILFVSLFLGSESFKRAKEQTGLYISGFWCTVLGGGPPVTTLNLFEYTYEGEDEKIEDALDAFGEIKRI